MTDSIPRLAFSVTASRVSYYDDVVQYMLNQKIAEFVATHGRQPSKQQTDFMTKQLVRFLIIRRDADTAAKLKIGTTDILLG